MRIVVLPGVLRPPSDTALLGGIMARLDYLRSIGVVDEALSERMVVVEGRLPAPAALLEPVS